MNFKYTFSSILMLSLSGSVTAAEAQPVSASTGFLQITLALAFVIGLMLFAAWAFRKIGPVSIGNKVPLKVVGGVNVGNRERVMVVEIADQWLILGVTNTNISNLGTLPKQTLPGDASAIPASPFQDWLKCTIEKRNSQTGGQN